MILPVITNNDSTNRVNLAKLRTAGKTYNELINILDNMDTEDLREIVFDWLCDGYKYYPKEFEHDIIQSLYPDK